MIEVPRVQVCSLPPGWVLEGRGNRGQLTWSFENLASFVARKQERQEKWTQFVFLPAERTVSPRISPFVWLARNLRL
jgi:hypothetical protein